MPRYSGRFYDKLHGDQIPSPNDINYYKLYNGFPTAKIFKGSVLYWRALRCVDMQTGQPTDDFCIYRGNTRDGLREIYHRYICVMDRTDGTIYCTHRCKEELDPLIFPYIRNCAVM